MGATGLTLSLGANPQIFHREAAHAQGKHRRVGTRAFFGASRSNQTQAYQRSITCFRWDIPL